jgi:hypothetical protein
MKTIAFLSLLLCAILTVIAGIAHAETETEVLFYGPCQWQFASSGCDATAMEAAILSGAARQKVDSTFIKMQGALSDSPCSWPTDFKNHLWQSSTVYLDTHGSSQNHLIETFATAAVRDTRLTWYRDHFGYDCLSWTDDPGYGITITKLGVETWFKPQLQASVALAVTACQSCALMNNWGTFSTARKGSSYLCYDYSPNSDRVCTDLGTIISTMSCEGFDNGGSDNTIGAAFDACGASGPKLFGWKGNRWNDEIDCKGRAARFVDYGAFDGAIHFLVSGEQRFSYYEIFGYRSEGSKPEKIATVDGRGSAAVNELRVYEQPVSDEYSSFTIVEIDNVFTRTTSPVFTWGTAPASDWTEQVTIPFVPESCDRTGEPIYRYDPQSGSTVFLDSLFTPEGPRGPRGRDLQALSTAGAPKLVRHRRPVREEAQDELGPPVLAFGVGSAPGDLFARMWIGGEGLPPRVQRLPGERLARSSRADHRSLPGGGQPRGVSGHRECLGDI